jgi:hypothetical protein
MPPLQKLAAANIGSTGCEKVWLTEAEKVSPGIRCSMLYSVRCLQPESEGGAMNLHELFTAVQNLHFERKKAHIKALFDH